MSILEILGLVFVMIIFPIPFGWIFIHRTIKFWRELGKKSYLIMILGWILAAFIIYLFKDYIVSYKLNYHYFFQVLGILIILIAFYIDTRRAKVFGHKQLIGLPEIAGKKFKQKLIARGIYSKIRHPRYLSYILSFIGVALLTKLLSLFILFPVFVLLMYLLIISEERELKYRFRDYEKYKEDVPMLIPRLEINKFIKYKSN